MTCSTMDEYRPTDYGDRVRALRDTGMGILEAQRQIDKALLLNALEWATTLDDMKGVLRALMEKKL